MKQEFDRTILITGVSSGIGLGMTKTLLDAGYRVFGSVRKNDRARELRRELGDRFHPLVFDVCSEDQLERAYTEVDSALAGHHLHALINNAGGAEIGPLLEVSPESFLRQLDTLVVGQLRVIQKFFPMLVSTGASPGKVFNISSVSGVGVNRFFGCYAAGKHALEGLSKTLREELRMYGVRVIVIAPANIKTNIWPKPTDEILERYKNTDYAKALTEYVRMLPAKISANAMTVDEYCAAFYEIFREPNPSNRYTIFKGKRWKRPFSRLSRLKVRVLRS